MARTLLRVCTRRIHAGLVVLLAASLLAAFLSPTSLASPDHHKKLHSAKHRLDHKINLRHKDVDEISARLLRAQRQLNTSLADLSRARRSLATAREQVEAATAYDQKIQARLRQAVVRLANARADVQSGRVAVSSQRDRLASYAVTNFQSGGVGALDVAVAFSSQTPRQATDAMQIAQSIADVQADELQKLQANQLLLRLTEQRVQRSRDAVARARAAAAAALAATQAVEARALAAQRTVLERTAALRSRRQQLVAAKQHELQRMKRLQAARDKVEARLHRIAEREAAARGALLLSTANGGGFLSYPVADPVITSPYGMRMNPVIHVYELHDGTDFGVPCGTPVYAAAAGTVSQEYYSDVYGNRLFVNHGLVHGISLWTAYNHLTSFVAHPGEHVDRGQLVAYSGTTGWSTGCHLHFMVFVNGATVDPVTWL